jgi:tRNA A-37 threonylcarbamoyl transferase component Bud32
MSERLLSARYALESEIQSGPLFTAWLATDTTLNRKVNVKMLNRRLTNDTALRERFSKSARDAAALVHPNIVAVFDTGEDDGTPFVVTEHLAGGSLRRRISNGPLSPEEVASTGADIAAGLAHAHQRGVVHGQITPETIFVSDRGRAKVGDFGLAAASIPAGEAATSGIIETPDYLAPEQVEGSSLEPQTDIYALGAVLFEGLTGHPPFSGESDMEIASARIGRVPPRPSSLRKGVSSDLDRVILKAMAPMPEERYRSASEMSTELLRIGRKEAGREIGQPGRRPSRQPKRKQPRPRKQTSFFRTEARWLAPTILVIALAAGLVFGVLRFGGELDELFEQGGGGGAEVESVAVQKAGSFDPEGSGEEGQTENEDRVGRAFDGMEDTFWNTNSYDTAEFGLLKDGLGIWFDLGEEREVASITVTSQSAGWEGSIRTSNDGMKWSAPSSTTTAADTQEFETSGSARYWMIWITKLARFEGGERPFSVRINEVELRARRS